MSLDALVWVLHNSHTRGSAKLVLLGLADVANSEGADAWPAVESLSAWAGIHERNVQRMLRYLEENGHIVREGEARARADRRPNSYRIVGVTPLGRGGANVTPLSDGVAPASRRGGASVANGVAPAPPEQSFNRPEPRARTRSFGADREYIPPVDQEASLRGALAHMDPEARAAYEDDAG